MDTDELHVLSIWGPPNHMDDGVQPSEPLHLPSRGGHEVHVVVALLHRAEGDPSAVRRNPGTTGLATRIGETAGGSTDEWNFPKVVLALEHHPFALHIGLSEITLGKGRRICCFGGSCVFCGHGRENYKSMLMRKTMPSGLLRLLSTTRLSVNSGSALSRVLSNCSRS